MKAFTERRPKVIGAIAVAAIVVAVLAILLLNRNVFNSGYTVTARFASAAGITPGTEVMVAGVKSGSVTSVAVHGNSVDAVLSVNRGVELPHVTSAAIEVETLLGVVDVTLQPVSGWQHPLGNNALITQTTVPTELYQLQKSGENLLSKTNAKALNVLVESLATITKGKQTQVAQIIKGLGALTTTVNQRSGQVSQLIDSANTLSSTLTAKDQALVSIVNNLDTVATGLAGHSTDLSNLITNVDQMAAQTNSLVRWGLPPTQRVVGQPPLGSDGGRTASGGSGRGRELPRWRAQGLLLHRLRRGPGGELGQRLRQSGRAHRHLWRHRSLRRPGRGAHRCVGTRSAALRRSDRDHARRGDELDPVGTGGRDDRVIDVDHRRQRDLGRPAGWPEFGRGRALATPEPAVGGEDLMARVRNLAGSRYVRLGTAVVVLAAGIVVGVNVTRASATYPLNAVYSSAPGLFPGAAVDVLGVPVGTVTSVTNIHDQVDVVMQVRAGTKIPAGAVASLVAPEVLGQPDVDLNPGYTGGPQLGAGDTIPESRTTVPVSTDQLLKQLQRTLNALNPRAVGDLITNLAQDLDGQGAGLNQLISSAAGTIQLLANKGDDLGQLDGTLAQLTGTLDSDTSQITQLVNEYDTVSTVIAQHSGQLNDAITQLSGASTALVTLLTPNLQPLEADVGTVTTVGRTLDRNITNVDEILQQANNLFQGAQRVFDPTYNWLDLNVALPVGVSGDYMAGLIRDRLAGVCRRIAANHGTGLSAATLASLASCGDPNSAFFDPLMSQIPSILSALSTGSGPTTATALLQQGLNQIGSLGAAPSPAGGAPGGSTPSGSGAAAPPPPSTTTTTTPAPGPPCGLLGAIVGCTPGSGTQSGSSSGLGGLLAQHVTPTKKQQATVNLASHAGGATVTERPGGPPPPAPSVPPSLPPGRARSAGAMGP